MKVAGVGWSGRAIAFVGARGGAGASSAAAFAAASLAQRNRAGASQANAIGAQVSPDAANPLPTRGDGQPDASQVLLCDLDEGHAGLDIALGLEAAPGFRWQHFADLTEPPAPELVVGSFPQTAGFDVWAWGGAANSTWQIVPMFLPVVMRNYQKVVFDVGRPSLPNCLEMLAACAIEVQWVLVCPGDVTSVNAAARVRPLLGENLRLLIRSDSQSGLRNREIAQALGVAANHVAAFTPDDKVHRALVRGEFGRLAATKPQVMNRIAQLIGLS